MRDPKVLEQVKLILSQLEKLAPGRSVEVRVPPYAAVQCVAGPRHTRGTPPNVVEMDHQTLFGLVDTSVRWDDAIADGRIHASGERSDLSELFGTLSQTIRMAP